MFDGTVKSPSELFTVPPIVMGEKVGAFGALW